MSEGDLNMASIAKMLEYLTNEVKELKGKKEGEGIEPKNTTTENDGKAKYDINQSEAEKMEKLYSDYTQKVTEKPEIDPETQKPRRLIIQDGVNCDATSFPLVVKENLMTCKSNRGKAVRNLGGAQINAREVQDLALEKVDTWDARFKKLAKQEHSDAVAEGMKRLKKELEQKDETQTEMVMMLWTRLAVLVV